MIPYHDLNAKRIFDISEDNKRIEILKSDCRTIIQIKDGSLSITSELVKKA